MTVARSGTTKNAGASDKDGQAPPVPLHKTHIDSNEHAYVRDAMQRGRVGAYGDYTARTEQLIARRLAAPRVLLTHSCTAALEIAALLTLQPGDEVILPSFTFAGTATAFARVGAQLVFVDIDPATLNIDVRAVAAAVTGRTRAIVAVHYAGVACDLAALKSIAAGASAVLIEDAAHSFGASFDGRPLGTFAPLAAVSFHETKNVTSGEGGALVINDPALTMRAQIVRDRGTNRDQFFRNEIDSYTWVELGSAFAPSDLIAAALLAQIERVDEITAVRRRFWDRYHAAFSPAERAGLARRPVVPAGAQHNGHIYYLLLPDAARRRTFLQSLNRQGIGAAFHYVPLHSSPAGLRYGRASGSLDTTEDIAARLVRLPLHLEMSEHDQSRVIDAAIRALGAAS